MAIKISDVDGFLEIKISQFLKTKTDQAHLHFERDCHCRFPPSADEVSANRNDIIGSTPFENGLYSRG